MPRTTTRSKQGQSTSKASRALANISSSALNRRDPAIDDGSKPTKKTSGNTNKQSEPTSNDTNADIDELGRRITRSMTLTLATTSRPENSGGRPSKTSRRRARLAAPLDPSNMRVTRSMALKDKRLTASKIPIDTIANIATYLAPNSEAMNVCLAVGPKGARIVRRRYLLHERFDNWSQSSTRFLLSSISAPMSRSRRCQMIEHWMLVNNKWGSWLSGRGAGYRMAPPLVQIDENSCTFNLAPLFANPGVAVVLGISSLLKLHVRCRKEFDVNAMYAYQVWGDELRGGEPALIHLVLIAMINDDKKTFDILLSHPDIDLNSNSYPDDHCPLSQALLICTKSKDLEHAPYFLRRIVSHRTFDVNAETFSGASETTLAPLQWLIMLYTEDTFPSPPRWALEIFVEAGANIHLESDIWYSPYELAVRRSQNMSGRHTDEDMACCLEALTVMQEWPASMKINGLVRGFLARRRLAAA